MSGRKGQLLAALLLGVGCSTPQGLSGRNEGPSCEQGNAQRCDEEAVALKHTPGPEANARRRRVLELGCEWGSPASCRALAIGATSWKHELERACALRYGLACQEAAVLWSTSALGAERAKAVFYAQRGCALGHGRACEDWAVYLARGLAGEPKAEAIEAVLSDSCAANSLEACRKLDLFTSDAPEWSEWVKAGLGLDEAPRKGPGGLDREVIARVVRQHMKEPKFCYERQLKEGATAFSGKVAVYFSIDPQGRTMMIQALGSAPDFAKVADCIERYVYGWRFPRPKGGGMVSVTYPFVFKSAAELPPGATEAPAPSSAAPPP